MEFPGFFSSEKWFGTEFQSFSLTRNRRNSDGTVVCSVLRGIIFLSENGNPNVYSFVLVWAKPNIIYFYINKTPRLGTGGA